MKYEHVLSPIKIRGMELDSRIMTSSMVTKLADNRHITDALIDYQMERVKGGLSLAFLEASSVHEPSASFQFLSLGKDEYVPELKKLTDQVHQAGGKIGVQLWQGGMVASMLDPSAECFIPSTQSLDVTVVAGADGSAISFPGASVEKIHEIVKAYGEAAARAVAAGFDVLEFHASHGYSAHAFLSPAFNHREDEYGGSFEKRARFPLEVIDEIRRNIPEEMPLFMRIAAKDDALGQEGLSLEETIKFCIMAGEHGVDALNVSRGNSFTAGELESPPVDMPRGFNVENAARIREETGMLTIAAGRINDPDQAEEIIAENKADMVVMSRAHLADPQLVNKMRAGKTEDIVRCIGCNQGCNDIVASLDPRHITCLMNPSVCREREMRVQKAEKRKKVMVVGGGVAGIWGAERLAAQGHEVVLVEKSSHLGGQFMMAGKAPRKEEFVNALTNRIGQIERAGVRILLYTEFSQELLKKEKPDEVLFTIGSVPVVPNIPGKDRANVVAFPAVLNGFIVPEGKIMVIGAGMVGLEVAEYLAARGRQVKIIEMTDLVGNGLGAMRRTMVIPLLDKEGVEILTETKCCEIKENSIIVEKDGQRSELECDAVVLALGSVSGDTTKNVDICKEAGIPYHIAGDAKEVTRAMESIADAVEVAMTI